MSNRIISFRIPTDRLELIQKICKNRGIDLSDFCREAIYERLARMSYLSEEEKKALGVKIMS